MNNTKSILITGDFCPVNRTSDLISDGNFELIFNDFLLYTRNVDLAITNLECPLTDAETGISKVGPTLKASVKSAEAISDSGFKLVTLANNHIMDYGSAGLASTINACKNNGINHVGAGANYDEARQTYYMNLEKYGIAIINITENEFSTTHGNYPGSNPLDPVKNYYDIEEAKKKANFVIVIVHGGHEMFNLPSPRIKSTFHFFADAGASVIVAHHTHCYSGYELYKKVPIFYGLGNFVFDMPNQRNSSWNYGYAVQLFIEEEITFNLIPYKQSTDQVGVRLINGSEKGEFFDRIEQLNNMIINDEQLNIEFERYCIKVKNKYFSLLEPHSIRLFNFLRNHKLLPSLLSKRKKIVYLNLIRCESHRDVLMTLLENRTHL